MILTKRQWLEMWAHTKQIEKLACDIREQDKIELRYQGRCSIINEETKKIKKLIESVIGKLE